MKIKCNKIISPTSGRDLGKKTAFFEVGEEYIPLSLAFRQDEGLYCSLYSEKNKFMFFVSMEGFEISSQKVPTNWIQVINEEGFFEALAKSWNYPSFSEDLSEGEPTAVDLFKKEAKKIYAEEGIEVEESFFTP